MRRCLVGLQFRRCSPGSSRAPPQMRVTAVTEAEACTAPTSTVPAAAIGGCARATAVRGFGLSGILPGLWLGRIW